MLGQQRRQRETGLLVLGFDPLKRRALGEPAADDETGDW